MQGKTTIDQRQEGNLDTQKIQTLVEAADGGASICEGGYNPFGRLPVSQECADYMAISTGLSREFNQQVLQGYVSGDLMELPAGMMSLVVGVESRKFDYALDPGSAGGAISGFNNQNPAGGENQFDDIFMEAYIPLLEDVAFASALDMTIGYRTSESEFVDTVANISSDSDRNSAYKVEFSWEIAEDLPRIRASYQRAVRAPNFGELFDGGGSAPQYFDPCSVTTQFRAQSGQQGSDLCAATGVSAPDIYVQTPGTQASITTDGNTSLKAETADTYTLGAVHTMENGLIMSLDYYSIDVQDAIIAPNTNLVIADCYNYYGNNPGFDANYDSCAGIVRGGGDIFFVNDPNTANGNIPGINSGFIKTSGLDFQAAYSFDNDWFGGSTFKLDFFLNYIFEYETQERDFLPAIDYSGTVGYFGAGLGQSFPEFKANLNGLWSVGDFDVALRGRYIADMDNRLNVEVPIETSPTGTDAIMYWDTSVTYHLTEDSFLTPGRQQSV